MSKDLVAFGGLSPAPKQMLQWVPNRHKAEEILTVARARFEQGGLDELRVRFGLLHLEGITAADLSVIELKKTEALNSESRWTGTILFQDISRLY